MTSDWPFDDAVRDDPLTALRIPVVTTFNPGWGYIGAYLATDPNSPWPDKPWPFASMERPTDAEARMIVSYIEEVKSGLTGWYLAEMSERPLDIDNYKCGHVFIKYGPDDWGYRRLSWTYGPTFVPGPPGSESRKIVGPLTLEQVIDRRHSIGDKVMKSWIQWKADHPDIFPPAPAEEFDQ